MIHKLNKILRSDTHPYLLTVGIVIIITLLTTVGGILHYGHEIQANSEAQVAAAVKKADSPVTDDKTAAGSNPTTRNTSAGSSSRTSNNNQSDITTATKTSSYHSSGASSTTKHSYIKVSLSVNGHLKGSVTLLTTANQCDVLKQAYADGLISSLDMRYNSQYKTYGVYVIDGIGDSSSVWWTYKVNGSSPPYGCSYMSVHNGDSVNWQYIKS